MNSKERQVKTPQSPLLEWEGFAEDGSGKFVFNGPGLLEYAERKGFQLSRADKDILARLTDEVGAELEGVSSLEEVDQDFIEDIAIHTKMHAEKDPTFLSGKKS